MTWDAVDLDNGIVTLRVGETKNDEGRTVYLDDELRLLFRELWEKRKSHENPSHFVFTNDAGYGPIVNIKRAWNKATRKAMLGYGYRSRITLKRKWAQFWAQPNKKGLPSRITL